MPEAALALAAAAREAPDAVAKGGGISALVAACAGGDALDCGRV